MVLRIFSLLDVKDLRHAALVCQVWWSVSLDPSLWRSLFLEAKRASRLEKAPKDCISAQEREDDDEAVDWKARYKSTFHFRKGIFLGDRKKTEIIIRLDTARFFTDDATLALTGEVTLNVASSNITTHGIYIMFEALERRLAPDKESEKTNVLWTVCNSVTDDVPWKQRNTRTLSYRQGTHRFRFRVPFPRSDTCPSITSTAWPMECEALSPIHGRSSTTGTHSHCSHSQYCPALVHD